MPYSQAIVDMGSTTSLFPDVRTRNTSHFKWNSILNFMYLAYTFSAPQNFDIFSKLVKKVGIIDFLIFQVTVGMTYMFMDFFIKQYTRKIDFNVTLNPLLKGISYGILMQSALWALLNANYLADSLRFFPSSLKTEPPWSKCPKIHKNITCIPTMEIISRCIDEKFTPVNETSAHIYYMLTFRTIDRNVFTSRFFSVAIVWIVNFFITTVTVETLVKILKLAFLWRFFSNIIIIIILSASNDEYLIKGVKDTLDISTETSFNDCLDNVVLSYGIGMVGTYDFGSISPYIMIDNAIMIYSFVFIICAFIRSVIVKSLFFLLSTCVDVGTPLTNGYLWFAVIPLSSEFAVIRKLYIVYIFFNNFIVATLSYLILVTCTISKIIQSEFRSVKSIYIVGILCFCGFLFSVISTMFLLPAKNYLGVVIGFRIITLYLGGSKVAVTMWIYGVQRFSTDVQFWLGFKPTKFWTICWSVLPIVLYAFFISRLYLLAQFNDGSFSKYGALTWITFSLLIVFVVQVKTITRFLVRNSLANILSCSAKYGPPDPEDRSDRKLFNETLLLRHCTHKCQIIDDVLDCNHLPLTFRNKVKRRDSMPTSMTNLYEAGPSRTMPSENKFL